MRSARRGRKEKRWIYIGVMLFIALFMGVASHGHPIQSAEDIIEYVRLSNSKDVILIRWDKNLDAVSYELEIFEGFPDAMDISENQPVQNAFYRNTKVFSAGKMLKLSQFKSNVDKPLFWRVRALDKEGEAVSSFTEPMPLYVKDLVQTRNAPVPITNEKDTPGEELLYPVYAYIANPDAVKYEVELTGRYPENPMDNRPSDFRIYSQVSNLMDIYDEFPRIGTFYWRVRGMDENGNAVGIWSEPQEIQMKTEDCNIAVYGDSVSHGGGHISFSPADLEFSYAHYLTFPVKNLSESGNTSEDMVLRFERDVLPFRPKYLLILGGTNSLRAGFGAASVIRDLAQIQAKCRSYGIEPILLTLPPINPSLIDQAFHEGTTENWREDFAAVNAFIRTQPHIDIAAQFEGFPEIPVDLALDGLHGDWKMKKMMADVINQNIGQFVK